MDNHNFNFNCWLVLLFVAALAASCGRGSSNNNNNNTSGDVAVVQSTQLSSIYTPPAVPAMMSSTEQRVEYFSTHYWDNFDFIDTTLAANRPYVEQAWSNFLAVVSQLPYTKAAESLRNTMALASVDDEMLQAFIEVSEKYLYNPNSPMRNDELFIPILEYIVSCDKLEELQRLRPYEILQLAKKNRIGTSAIDFQYTLADGSLSNLYSIESDYLLVFFNNPDCEDCRRVKSFISSSSVIGAVRVGESPRLTILSIYPSSNRELWQGGESLDGAINAYDSSNRLTTEQLYDLKAVPTLYLLDKQKRVLLKDAPVEIIEHWLSSAVAQ